MTKIKEVENKTKEVYNFCPPTKTHYISDKARDDYKEQWGRLFKELGLVPSDFKGLQVLDAGCGSCEKATFYSEWGAHVTGVDTTSSVLKLAKDVIGTRDIKLIQTSIFDFKSDKKFDLIISDGVLHCTANTCEALKAITAHLKPGGHVVFSLINVWGILWWFPFARFITRVLGGSSFHRRAYWGKVLFLWTRKSQEGTKDNAIYFRSEESWAYDFFAIPRWNQHSPSEIKKWLDLLGLDHVKSYPSIVQMENPKNSSSRLFKKLLGGRSRLIGIYWLINREFNTMYIHASKKS